MGGREKAGWLPQRYIFVIMGSLSIFNAYSMRAAMSVAITEMAEAEKNSRVDEESCSIETDAATNDPGLILGKAEFEWDEVLQGYVLGALFWGYVAMNVPSGLLADRFGGKLTMLGGMLICSVSTLLIPLAARKGGAVWVIVARFFEGLGESGCYPGANNMLAFWGPGTERSSMGSILFAGNLLGQVVGTALSGVIISGTGDWASVFYVFGSIGLVWCATFYFTCYDTPAKHPRISSEERKYIETAVKEASTKRPQHIPWGPILTSLPVWALVVGQLGHDWVLFTLGTELPKYMKSVLHYSVSANGLLSALPNLMTWIMAFLSGWLSDYVIRTGRLSVAMQRKWFTTFSCVAPAVFLLGATYARCDRVLVIFLFCVGMACMGPFYSSLKVNALDISPNYSGLVMSVVNGLGAVSGIVSPDIVGLLIPNSTLPQWRNVFWVTLGVCIVCSLIYLFFGTSELQPWNTVVEDNAVVEDPASSATATPTASSDKKEPLPEDAVPVKAP